MNLIEDIIDETLNIMSRTKRRSIVSWTSGILDEYDLRTLDEEFSGSGGDGSGEDGGGGDSPFDPLQIRQKAWKKWREAKIEPAVFECSLGKIVGLFPNPQSITKNDVPLSLWSWILAAFAPRGVYVRIYFVGSDLLRLFPTKGKIGPEHINGGYCYPCRKQPAVFIFRAEDARSEEHTSELQSQR